MLRFFAQVVIAAAFWAVVVWFGLPWLKDHEPEAYRRVVRQTIQATPEKASGYIVDAVEAVEHNVRAIKDNPPELPEMPPRMPDSQKDQPSVTVAPDKAVVAGGDNVSATNNQEVAVVAPPVALPVALQEEVEDPLSSMNKDPGYNWGIVVTNSFFYDEAMKVKGILAGGAVVESKSLRLLPDGRVAECFFMTDRRWNYDTVHLYESDLVLFDVPYERAPKATRDLLIEYCKLLGRLEELRVKLHKELILRNPHMQEYRAVTAELNAFVQKAKQAQADFEISSGSQRMTLMDQLRQYKAEEAGILRRYNETKRKYDSWKTENLGDGRTGRSPKTPEMQSIENKLNAMRPAVHEIVPGL